MCCCIKPWWYGVVLASVVLVKALLSLKYVVCALDLSRLLSWQVVALCLAILRILMNLCYIERVGVAKYPIIVFGIVCDSGWCILWLKEGFLTVTHILGKSKLKELHNLDVRGVHGLP